MSPLQGCFPLATDTHRLYSLCYKIQPLQGITLKFNQLMKILQRHNSKTMPIKAIKEK